MEVHPLIYIILLLIVISGPVMANIAYSGWKNVLLARLFIVISILSMAGLMFIVLL